MQPAAIAIEHLTKHYGALKAVDDLSLTVHPGEFFGLLGPNGAGKTTTISAIVGLVRNDGGQIRVMGHDVQADYRQARRIVGLSAQEYNFDRYLSIEDVLIYQAGYFGIPTAIARPRAHTLLKQFGLFEKRDVDYLKLSGGMKRRLTIARALIHEPKVLILDEPTAGTDVALRLELWQQLRELNRQGLTIVLTTHYLEEAEELCKRIAIMREGRIVALDETKRLIGGATGQTLTVHLSGPLTELPLAWQDRLAHVTQTDEQITVTGVQPADVGPLLAALGDAVTGVSLTQRNLQDLFLELTGERLPETDEATA
ncbi:MAG: ABC transporter ATP-binding protein [Candidatus Sericytochromatia bacterium]|nr:ABC transporter ATP-binding protein [Candidatus Sericytochromatia bacterium]